MDAFLQYLEASPAYRGRLLISQPPKDVVLAWARMGQTLELAGVTIVSEIGQSAPANAAHLKALSDALSAKGVKVLSVQYARDLSKFIVDGNEMSAPDAAVAIGTELRIKLGANAAKKPNDPGQVSDPFHVWSRDVFDGIAVRKTDIDAFVFDAGGTRAGTMLEIKRSNRVAVGSWRPYAADYFNYVIQLKLCELLGCDFVTVHHDRVGAEVFGDNMTFDHFGFVAGGLVDDSSFSTLAAESNRKNYQGKDVAILF